MAAIAVAHGGIRGCTEVLSTTIATAKDACGHPRSARISSVAGVSCAGRNHLSSSSPAATAASKDREKDNENDDGSNDNDRCSTKTKQVSIIP